MERNYLLTKTMAAGAVLATGIAMQQAHAADFAGRSAWMTIDIPCKSVSNNGDCNIDQIYYPSEKVCKASITPKGRIASERVLYRERTVKNKMQISIIFGFELLNTNSPNGTDVQNMKVQVTGNPGGKRFDVTRNENDGLLVELLDSNKAVNLTSYNGANGARGSVKYLTSSDGKKYKKDCKQEMKNGKAGVSVNDILNGVIGACVSPSLKDTSPSNNNAGAQVATYSTDDIVFPPGPGNYLVTATATLKSMYSAADDLIILASKRIHVNDNSTCAKINPPPMDDIIEQPSEPEIEQPQLPEPPTGFDNNPFGDSGLDF
jgi:hypothetical protein